MNFLISDAHAQAAGSAAADPISPLIMMVVFFAIFYFIAIRPQMKRAKEHRSMLDGLGKGDEVVTSGGILGRVTDMSDAFITVEISDKLEIKVQKHAIAQVMPKGTLKEM